MRNSPFAMLITPIWPNVSVSPSAASNRMAPVAVPVRKGVVSTSIVLVSDPFCCHIVETGHWSGGDPAFSDGSEKAGSGDHLGVSPCSGPTSCSPQERIGLDRAVGTEDDVELVLGVDL